MAKYFYLVTATQTFDYRHGWSRNFSNWKIIAEYRKNLVIDTPIGKRDMSFVKSFGCYSDVQPVWDWIGRNPESPDERDRIITQLLLIKSNSKNQAIKKAKDFCKRVW